MYLAIFAKVSIQYWQFNYESRQFPSTSLLVRTQILKPSVAPTLTIMVSFEVVCVQFSLEAPCFKIRLDLLHNRILEEQQLTFLPSLGFLQM